MYDNKQYFRSGGYISVQNSSDRHALAIRSVSSLGVTQLKSRLGLSLRRGHRQTRDETRERRCAIVKRVAIIFKSIFAVGQRA